MNDYNYIYKNKYFYWYMSIINKSVNNNKSKNDDIYYELHHIIPKSIGGTNEDSNLVLLSAREHFICHKLLTKCTYGKLKSKMICAYWRMCNPQGGIKEFTEITSRNYEYGRKAFAKYRTTKFKHTDETKKKISLSSKGKNNGMYGRKRTKEEIQQFIKTQSKGKFITPWGTFYSAGAAVRSNDCPIDIPYITILNYCERRNDKPFESIRGLAKYYKAIKGQTPKDLGFYFIPKY